MTEDSIIEELHRIREGMAAKHHYDVHAIAAEIRHQQQAENRHVVSLPPKRIVSAIDSISEVKERVSELIHREKTLGLSPEETAELDDYLKLEHLGKLAKARLRQSQADNPASQK